MPYNSNNIFAKIIRGEVNCNKVYEDNQIIAFNDIAPISPVHILVVPKLECRNFTDFINLASSENIAYFFNKLSEIANLHCPSGFRIITNNGKDADQTVEHFHIHIIGGAKLKPLAH